MTIPLDDAATPDDLGAALERALELFLQHRTSGATDDARLLREHPQLRELLEPMLNGASAEAAAGDTEAGAIDGEDGDADDHADGVVLGDFRLVRELGRGGMGVVHEAWQRSLDRRVALKVLAPALVADASAIARFHREAASVARLRHPNIVEVYGFGTDADQHWFAMQLVRGEPLHRCMDRFRSPTTAVPLIAQVVDALQHAHAAGLVHRDVKPANVLVRADDSAVLTDFGLASDSALPTVTTAGAFLGTLDYSSPEQVRGERATAAADIWAIGVMLYELLAGVHPFRRATPQATMHGILTASPVDVRSHNSAVGVDLAAVVGRALETRAERRYASAVALLADLRAVQAGHGVSARIPTQTERLRRWIGREPWRAATVFVLALAVPAVAAASGYLWANAPRIEAAAVAESQSRREDAVAQAWFCLSEQDGEAGLAALATAGDDLEVAVVRGNLLKSLGRDAEAARCLAPFRESGALRRVETWLEGEPDAARIPTDATQIELIVAAALLFDRHRKVVDDPRPFAVADQLLRRAVALSPAPRLPVLVLWLEVANLAEDSVACAAAEAALDRFFGSSRSYQLARARTQAVREPAAAVPVLQQISTESPREAWPHFCLGQACELLERFDDAEREYRRCTERQPQHARAWNNLGLVLRRKHDDRGAVAAFRAAVAAAPGHAKAWSNLGSTLRALGSAAEAKDALTQAVQARPDYAPGHYNLGNLLMTENDVTGAIAEFRAAVAADPGYSRAQSNLGSALARAGRKQEALVEFVRAASLAPQDVVPQYNLARMAIDLGMTDLALAAAERASSIAADDASSWRVLAEALLSQPVVDAPRALASARRADELSHGHNARIRVLLARATAAGGDRPAGLAILDAMLRDPGLKDEAVRTLVRETRDRLGRD